jgi:hypothetical protein
MHEIRRSSVPSPAVLRREQVAELQRRLFVHADERREGVSASLLGGVGHRAVAGVVTGRHHQVVVHLVVVRVGAGHGGNIADLLATLVVEAVADLDGERVGLADSVTCPVSASRTA